MLAVSVPPDWVTVPRLEEAETNSDALGEFVGHDHPDGIAGPVVGDEEAIRQLPVDSNRVREVDLA